MNRKRVLGAVALLSVAIVAALFVLQRKSIQDTAAPSLRAPSELVAPFDDATLDSAKEERGTSNASDRVEVAVPLVDVLANQPPSPRLRFVVVDAGTLEPIEKFALRVRASSAKDAPNAKPFEGEVPINFDPTSHFGGICELPDEAEPFGYQIRAPGHAPQEGWIDATARTPNGQVIRLERGGSISGRVFFDDKPASNLIARLRPAALGERDSTAARHDLSAFLGTYFNVRIKDGELHMTDLAMGTYRLEIRGSHGLTLVVDRVAVVVGVDTPLGELGLTSNPIVNGVVLFPGDRMPPKYKLTVTCADQIATARIDTAGKFTIDTLPAGHWVFGVPAREEFVSEGVNLERDVASIAGQQITLDLRDRTGCWLTAHVLINGKPLQDAYVGLEFSTQRGLSHSRQGMPRTNESGESRAWQSRQDATALYALSRNNLPIAHRALDPLAASDTNLEVVLDAEVGGIIIDWSELGALITQVQVSTLESSGTSLDYTQDGITLEIKPNDDDWHRSGGFRVGDGGLRRADGHRADFGPISVGAHSVTLSVLARPRPTVFRKQIDIRVGQITVCTFGVADRLD